MGLSIRTLDDGWVDLGDCDLQSDPAKGEIIGAMETERYSCGDIVYFDGQSRTEIVNISELSKVTDIEIIEILEYTELGYIIEIPNGETTHIKISDLHMNR